MVSKLIRFLAPGKVLRLLENETDIPIKPQAESTVPSMKFSNLSAGDCIDFELDRTLEKVPGHGTRWKPGLAIEMEKYCSFHLKSGFRTKGPNVVHFSQG